MGQILQSELLIGQYSEITEPEDFFWVCNQFVTSIMVQ